MSYARVISAGLTGVTGQLVEVEAYLAPGLPGVHLTGLPDSALNEARDRVRAAITNAGREWPSQRITVNLFPAYLRKRGSCFDLAIALAVLGGTGELPLNALRQVLLVGELGLDGSIRPVRGVLPMAAAAVHHGVRRAIVPHANSAEAALVPGLHVLGAPDLASVIRFVQGAGSLIPPGPAAESPVPQLLDLADVAGQELGRLAIEVAAAGGHHVAFKGPPGAGKSMLAKRLPSLLPPLDDDDALEVTSLHSVAGALPPGAPLIRRPPLQAPHHTASVSALVGGGSGLPRPGALSLAHKGVLLLDEAPEFAARALDALRQPLEEGIITISRTQGVVVYPAQVQLVLTANPCPCANSASECQCQPQARRRYLRRLSGPLLDRIDIQIETMPLSAAHLLGEDYREPSSVVAQRVAEARQAAIERWRDIEVDLNATVPPGVLRKPPWRLEPGVTAPLMRLLDQGSISARGYDRILRVAWTLADLAGLSRPGTEELNIAIELRHGEAR